jgi:YegS/Rv2252/BmrU family lipid kinase
MPHVVAIANPASGSAGSASDLAERFAPDVTIVHTTEDDPGTGQAAQAVRDGADTVVACGGDGTVRAVLEALAGGPAQLGVVALGTGNLLAANLDLPTELDEAIATATSGGSRRLDLGTVNGERFAVMAGVGFDALMIRDANPKVKRRFGSIAYVMAAVRNVPARLVPATIAVDGRQVWSGRTAMVLVGNCGTVSGGLTVFPDALCDDGRLDVAVLSAKRLRDWLSVGFRLIAKRPQRSDMVARFMGREIHVRLARPMPYELDGEARDPVTSLEFGIEPSALTVRCGQAVVR